jgi:hypothetical protein
MKARVYDKKLHPKVKSHMRSLIEAVVHLYLVEVEGFGAYGIRWNRVKEYADNMLDKYDKLYPRYIDTKLDAMLRRCEQSGVYYDKRHGGGEKYLLAKEQDVTFLPYLLAVRTIYGWGEKKMLRMKKGVNDRIRYYNTTFEDESLAMLDVMRNRLERYKT